MSSASISGPLPPDVSRASDLVIVTWVTFSLASLLVSLRIYIRGVLRKILGWDDYLILLAIVSSDSSILSKQPFNNKLCLGFFHRAERRCKPPDPERVRSEHPVCFLKPDWTLHSILQRVYPAPACRYSFGQGLSMPVCLPSHPSHKDVLPQVDMGAVGIHHHAFNYLFPCL